MSIIKVMSENLANKIAAGEVIEKCSAVVKELVENSIDAGSSNITIELENGGLSKIAVIDNGKGMDKEDAILAFSRHATSKIYKDDDLFFIDTLGFRGEALPSIAAVSEVVLDTCNKDIGTHIHIKGGNVLENTFGNARMGTSITVTNLFYNTPARLKYLKSEQTELSNIVSFVERISLAKSNISFTLKNNDNVIVKTRGSGNVLKTIHEVYGSSISSRMLEIKSLNDDFVINGYVSKPELLRSNKNHMITFINGRIIKNSEINKAINDAYYTYKPVDKYPVVVINIEVDPTLVDVNIHPTKQDVKISKMDSLYNLLYETIKDALNKSLLIPDMKSLKEVIKDSIVIEDDFEIDNVISDEEEIVNVIDSNEIKTDIKDQLVMDFGEDNKEENIKTNPFKNLVLYPVGLCHGTYIICENDEGIYLIDQHAAQERVNYEKYLEALKNEKTNITSMLIPIVVELSQSDYILFEENKEIFTKMGFEYNTFGVNTIKIISHPTWLRNGYEEEQIRKIIDMIISINKDFDEIKFREHVAITLACKMAIKANEHISMMEIEALINNLVKCEQPYNCPHGRPTIIKFSIYDLEKMFKRAMD